MTGVATPRTTALTFTPPRAAEDEELIWFLGSLLTVKATGETTGGAFDLVEELIAPGFAPPPHIHHREEECFYLIEGRMTFTCGDRTIEAGPGAFVVLPRGIPHTFRVVGPEPARTIMINTPAGLLGFFRDYGETATARTLPPAAPPDLAKLRRVAEAYGCDIPSLAGR